MPRHDYDQRFLRSIGGRLPECFGHYEAGNVECDEAPCAARTGCRMYRELCRLRGVDPSAELRVLGDPAVTRLVVDALSQAAPPGGSPEVRQKLTRGWHRFRDTVAEELPAGLFHPHREFAVFGELYAQEWVGAKDRLQAGTIRVKGIRGRDRRADLALARYWVARVRRTEPSIEIRADFHELLARWPSITGLCFRWSLRAPKSGEAAKQDLGATAERVFPDRIEDVARLFVRALEAEMLPVKLTPTGIEVT